MPDAFGPSEFGGKAGVNRIQPPPHEPTASEQLMLLYTTGDPTGAAVPDDGEAMQGLLPLAEQRAIREAEGALDKGQVWEGMTS
jgi:hypothetical protein